MDWWHYWWLLFPILGVAGGAYRRWERGAKARHERRLELLRVKNELRQATTASAPVAPPRAELPDQTSLTRLFAAHDAVTHRWLEYELDVSKLIAYPAMSDGRQPLTAAFLRAKKAADNLRPESTTTPISAAQLAEYRNAVTDYEVAFEVAERDARRVKDSAFSAAERKRLETAQQLLTVAVDQAATPNERQLAYRRVREELDGLIWLSDEAVDELEKKVSLELPRGSSDAPDGPPPASPSGAATPPAAPPVSAPPSTPPPPAPRRSPTAPGGYGETAPPGRVIRPKPSA